MVSVKDTGQGIDSECYQDYLQSLLPSPIWEQDLDSLYLKSIVEAHGEKCGLRITQMEEELLLHSHCHCPANVSP
jgi:hypothetical protein